jgi:hypothetical protein
VCPFKFRALTSINTAITQTILTHFSYQEPLIYKRLEVEKTHVITSPNLQSKDPYNSLISPNEENKMQFIWRIKKGKKRGRKMNSPLILDINQEEATSMKWGYKTTSPPLDFWRSFH